MIASWHVVLPLRISGIALMEECTGKSTGCELRIIRAEAEVDARAAQCTLDAHRLDGPVGIGERGHADNSIQLEQCDCRRRVIKIDLAGCELLLQSLW